MPSDASIYSMIQTPKQELPLDTAGKAMTIRALMNQNALSGIQQQQAGLQLDEQQRLRQLFANNPNPSVGDVMAASPTAGMKFQQFQLDKALKNTQIEEGQTKVLAAKALDARNSLAGVTDQASYDQWRQYGAQKGYQVAVSAPAQYDPNWQKQHLYTADKFLEQLNQKGVPVDTGSGIQFRNPQTGEGMGPVIPKTLTPEAKLSAEITKRGQDLSYGKGRFAAPQEFTGADGKPKLGQLDTHTGNIVDPDTKQPLSNLGPKLNQPTPPSVGQVGMLNSAKQDLAEFKSLLFPTDSTGKESMDKSVLYGINVPFTSGAGITTEQRTKSREAYSRIYNAVAAKLRLETGAQANPSEIQEIMNRYMPTPLDTKTSAKDKVDRLESYITGTLALTRGQGTEGGTPPVSAAPQVSTGKIKFLGFEK